MRRTQLYLDDDLWNALRTRARKEGSTVSDLVRQAARERYRQLRSAEAMQALVRMRTASILQMRAPLAVREKVGSR